MAQPLIISIILLLCKEWLPALFCFIAFLFFAIPCIIWRKLFFAKIEFSEDGVSKVLWQRSYKQYKMGRYSRDKSVASRFYIYLK